MMRRSLRRRRQWWWLPPTHHHDPHDHHHDAHEHHHDPQNYHRDTATTITIPKAITMTLSRQHTSHPAPIIITTCKSKHYHLPSASWASIPAAAPIITPPVTIMHYKQCQHVAVYNHGTQLLNNFWTMMLKTNWSCNHPSIQSSTETDMSLMHNSDLMARDHVIKSSLVTSFISRTWHRHPIL